MTSPLLQALAFQNARPPPQTGIAPTDVIGSYNLASNVAEKNYQNQLAWKEAQWGGLAGLGSAGISAAGQPLMWKYLGLPATSAAKTAANQAAGTTTTAPATAAGSADASAAPGWLDTVGPGTPSWAGGTSTAGAMPSTAFADASPPIFGVDAVSPGASTVADASGTPGWLSSVMGANAPAYAAPTIAADLGTDAAGAAGAGTVASDLAAAAPVAGAAADATVAGLPAYLASFLPFLAA
jgi:hypothetical protein